MQFYLNQNLTSERQLSTEILENYQFINTELNFSFEVAQEFSLYHLSPDSHSLLVWTLSCHNSSKISLPCKSPFGI